MTLQSQRVGLAALVIVAISCAAPTTHLSSVGPDVVRAEQLKQQQLVIESDLKLQRRLDDIAFPLLVAARPLCGQKVAPLTGVRYANAHSFKKDYVNAARALGFTDTLTIVGIAKGSVGERAGLSVGDRVLNVAGMPAPVGPNAMRELGARFAGRTQKGRRNSATESVGVTKFTVRRFTGSAEGGTSADISLELNADTVCASAATVVKADELNAWADGRGVYITSAMMRFANDDEELAVVVAHEIAHNGMRHIEARKKNATLGALFGALFDIAAATQGINTGGDFASLGAEFGAMTFSQDFEREADYVGLYILARAGRPLTTAPNVWRRMAQESPGSIKFASSHPTTAERFVRLEQAAAEIERKRSEGVELVPEMKLPASKGAATKQ